MALEETFNFQCISLLKVSNLIDAYPIRLVWKRREFSKIRKRERETKMYLAIYVPSTRYIIYYLIELPVNLLKQ